MATAQRSVSPHPTYQGIGPKWPICQLWQPFLLHFSLLARPAAKVVPARKREGNSSIAWGPTSSRSSGTTSSHGCQPHSKVLLRRRSPRQPLALRCMDGPSIGA
jgi:hypothetical protein